MPKCLLIIFLALCRATLLNAQEEPSQTPDQIQKDYEMRIRQERINGIYIPKDLADCFSQLNKLIDESGKEKFKTLNEEDAWRKLFFSFGRWIILKWSLYEGSRFSVYLRSFGVTHPDDMAMFVMITYHRYLNKEDLKIKELVTRIKEKQKQEVEEKHKKGNIIKEEVIKKN